MLTTLLDLFGVLAVCVFAFLVWPPLALPVLGAAALLLSWSITRGGSK